MRVVIAGGHGQIALLLSAQLAEAGHQPVGLIRNPGHADDVSAAGAAPFVMDLEQSSVDELAGMLDGADAVVFAAGAGPGSGPARKLTVDRDGAILLADAAVRAGVRRYVMVSSIRADAWEEREEAMQPYLRAKSEADAAVRARDLDWTIVRPGGLTNDPPTGRVTAEESTDHGRIPRADVAATILAALEDDATIGRQFELVSGDQPIAEALHALVAE